MPARLRLQRHREGHKFRCVIPFKVTGAHLFGKTDTETQQQFSLQIPRENPHRHWEKSILMYSNTNSSFPAAFLEIISTATKRNTTDFEA